VHTPKGAPVALLDDEQAIELLGSRSSLRQWATRAPIVSALWDDAPFENASGQATMLLFDSAKRHGYQPKYMTSLVAMLNGGLEPFVEREIRGRRTYRIALSSLPAEWYKRLDHANGHGLRIVEASEPEPEAPSEPEPEPEAPSDFPAEKLAAALLAHVVDVLATPDRNASAVVDLERRLGEQVSYVENLRRKLSEASDLAVALTSERDGLRRELRDVRANLDRIIRDDGRTYIDAQVRRELERIMRQTPTLRDVYAS
jgi:hypothetical protein